MTMESFLTILPDIAIVVIVVALSVAVYFDVKRGES